MSHVAEPWYHAGISAHDAIDMLEREANGSFLFRPSSSDGFLSLSYKGKVGDDTIHHIRVQVLDGKYLTDGDPKHYADLTAFVKARNSILKHPVMVVGAPDAAHVQELVGMGFAYAEACAALQQANGAVDKALQVLMAGGGAAAVQQQQSLPPLGQAVVFGKGTKRATEAVGAGAVHGPVAVCEDQNVKNKSYMEDGYVVVPNFGPNMAFFAVYDGHSGREATEHAQSTLHKMLAEALRSANGDFEAAWRAAYKQCDDALLHKGVKSAGCTSVTALVVGGGAQRDLYVANAGDARAVLARGGQAVRVSFDHKVEDEAETKRIQAAGGTILWGRVQGQTMVSRAIGDHDLKEYVISDPYTRHEVLDAACTFLVIACDGIWDVASDQEVVDCVSGMSEPRAMSEKIIEMVLEKGTKDNLTAMVVML